MRGIALLLGYAVVMIITTVIFTRKSKTNESFHVGDRNMGAWQSGFSIAATWIWAPALLVSAEQAYTNGFPGVFWFLVPNVLCLLFFIPFAKKIREQMPHGITLSGYMGEKYKDKKVKGIYLFQLGGLAVLSTAVQLLAGAKILSMLTPIPFWLLTILLSVVVYAYSQFSGIRASIITDVLQMVLILLACAVFVPWALGTNNGMESFITGFLGSGDNGLFSDRGMAVLFSFGLPTAIGLISGPFGDQCFWQRAFCTRKDKIAKAFAIGAFVFALVPISMAVLGFIASGSGFVATDTSIVNLELVTHLFPTWAAIPFILMLLSGLMSTMDSNLCAVASLTTDMQITSKLDNAGKLKFSKTSMLLLLVAGNLIANIPGLSVSTLFLIYGTLRATTLIPTVLTLRGKKLTANGVFYAVLASLCFGLPVFAYGALAGVALFKTIGCILTLAIGLGVSLIVSRAEAKKHAN